MAVAGIIAAAVGVMLLIVVGYVVVGATITTAETVTNAQKDVTLQNEKRLGTAIAITNPENNSSIITSNITNTGTEIISDFNHMDVLVYDTGSDEYQICIFWVICFNPIITYEVISKSSCLKFIVHAHIIFKINQRHALSNLYQIELPTIIFQMLRYLVEIVWVHDNNVIYFFLF